MSMLLKNQLKVQYFNIISYKPVHMQSKGKYASKEEYSEDNGSIREKRKLKAGNFRNHEK